MEIRRCSKCQREIEIQIFMETGGWCEECTGSYRQLSNNSFTTKTSNQGGYLANECRERR